MVRRSVADDSYGRAPLTWSVELGEVDALPRAEHELAFVYRERHIVTDEHRFDVRGGISFSVTVVSVLRNELRELIQQVTLHVRVRVLVHEDRRGGVRDIYDAYTFAHLRSGDRGAYAGCHIDGRLVLVGADGELLVVDAHRTIIRPATILPACRRGVRRARRRRRACGPPLTPIRPRSTRTSYSPMCSASGRKPCSRIPSANSRRRRTWDSSSSSSDAGGASRSLT